MFILCLFFHVTLTDNYSRSKFVFISDVFPFNLVCRNTFIRGEVLSDLHSVFPELYSIHIEGEAEIPDCQIKPRVLGSTEDCVSKLSG